MLMKGDLPMIAREGVGIVDKDDDGVLISLGG